MKQLIISIAIGLFVSAGFSQSQTKNSEKSSAPGHGLKMKAIQIEKDYNEKMKRSAEKKKIKSAGIQSEKKAVVKDMKNTNHRSKHQSSENIIPKRILNLKKPVNFGQGKEQFYSRIKIRKKLHQVEGFAPRGEMKKIDGHPQVSKEILIRALGNRKQFHIRSDRTE